MAVPAHDTRDHEFALKYNIPISWVITPVDDALRNLEKAYTGEGTMINSSSSLTGLDINGLPSKTAASRVIEWLENSGYGKKQVLPSSCFWGLYWVLPSKCIFTIYLISGKLQATRLAFCPTTLLGRAYSCCVLR